MQKAAYAYLQTNLNTSSPGETVLALYDGAIKFLQQAKERMEVRDYAKKGILIAKAIDIINELSSALNREKGGSLADNLLNLYFLCNARLAMANLRMDQGLVDSVIHVLGGLREAFAQIQNNPEAQAAGAEIAGRQMAGSAAQLRGMGAVSSQAPVRETQGASRRGAALYGKMAGSGL